MNKAFQGVHCVVVLDRLIGLIFFSVCPVDGCGPGDGGGNCLHDCPSLAGDRLLVTCFFFFFFPLFAVL